MRFANVEYTAGVNVGQGNRIENDLLANSFAHGMIESDNILRARQNVRQVDFAGKGKPI